MSITSRDRQAKVNLIAKLEEAFTLSLDTSTISLTPETKGLVEAFHLKIDEATSAFTNVVTCLAVNACNPSIDPRYHRKPGNSMPENPTGADNFFSGRSLSEDIIYPWLEGKGYRTAKSGWQTRTFERPQPYTLAYPENIGVIKNEFLSILNNVAVGNDAALHVLAHFFLLEEAAKLHRVAVVKSLAKGRTLNDLTILEIINLFIEHFKEPDSARLPSLAIYAAYSLLVQEVKSYQELQLLPLAAHEAADIRTQSIGDIELIDADGDVTEALEIKHNILINNVILLKAKEKILRSQAKRYYILTTHSRCSEIDDESIKIIKQVYKEHGCQIIVNGVLPTIKYYLRLISNPNEIINAYSALLIADSAVKTHHITKWEALITASN